MRLDSFAVIAQLRIDIADVVQHAPHSSLVLHVANQLERSLVEPECLLPIA